MKFGPEPTTQLVRGRFARPDTGLRFDPPGALQDLPLGNDPAWQSNGGPSRRHPARACAYTLDIPLPSEMGDLCRVYLVGVFARWAGPEFESQGTLGATVHLMAGGEVLLRCNLVNGRHYSDAHELSDRIRLSGDGASVETLGDCLVDGEKCRVDALTIDIPPGLRGTHLRFKDLGSPASFLLFDVLFEYRPVRGCPFHSAGGRIALEELGGIVRSGNRIRLQGALAQLEDGLLEAEDLDEARGQALTFLAVVTAAMLEAGGPRSLHRVQLQAARALDAEDTCEAVAAATHDWVERVVAPMVSGSDGPSGRLVDRAIAIVDRHFAKSLTDAAVAKQLGLSTSHFRYLFKQATGQPFHKYLVAIRLERARQMLIEEDLSVSEVAEAVGFAGLSHFSRAFAARFHTSPSNVRRAR